MWNFENSYLKITFFDFITKMIMCNLQFYDKSFLLQNKFLFAILEQNLDFLTKVLQFKILW